MKTLTLEAGAVRVAEAVKNPDGTDGGRSWSFANASEARKQRAEFEIDLAAPENAPVKAALDAAAVAVAPK